LSGLSFPGLLVMDEPYVPEQRRLYWCYPPLLDADDPEPSRPAVVLIVSTNTSGETLIAWRSTTEQNGALHEKGAHPDLPKTGWFSRSRTVNPELWTPTNAKSIADPLLDEETFAHVWNDHVPEGLR
jgi:hypothetical protein